ncbi:MAG TPA: class I SAM-dependent methyltransferase [Streptosporangiaceae bacterium]|nr:class I SAM-dependent methyltransferase [Streptosporangiaceae bacterium]
MTGSSGEIWDRRFAEQAWPTDPDPYLVELARSLPPGRGLDLGAGPGRNSLWLADTGWDMTLVDVSSVGLDQALAAAGTLSVAITTVLADVYDWQPDEAGFDLVIVANLHPGPDALAVILASAARALRPGGHLYAVGHHVGNRSRHADPSRLLTADRLRGALPADLSVDVLDTRPRAFGDGRPDRPGESVVLAWTTKPAAARGGHR